VNGVTTLFVRDGDREVLDYAGNTAGGQTAGQVQHRYVYGNGLDEVLSIVDPATGNRATPVPDIQGSRIALIDGPTGTVTKAGYTPYGESADTSGAFRYAGQRIDAETNGLTYNRARMYAPGLGRFLQPDPIGYSGGRNLYAYVGNDPLNLIDPSGNAGQLGWEALSLTKTATAPELNFYQNSIVAPFRTALTAVAQSPLGDAGLIQSLQGMGPPGALVGGTLRILAGIGRAAEAGPIAGGSSYYQVFSEQPISGLSRTAQRATANQGLLNDLQSDPNFAQSFNNQLGTDVVSHMQSGANGLRNPPGLVWHHPIDNPSVVQLVPQTEHTDAALRDILHPGGIGGYGAFYGSGP
jgi:RHS repeat-associated protein